MVMDIEFRKFLPLPVDSLVGKVCTAFVYIATTIGVANGMSADNYTHAIIGVGLATAALGATYWYNFAHDDDYGNS